METKKSEKADLERSRLTGFLLGLAVSVSVFITVLNFNSSGPDAASEPPLDHLIKDLSIPAVDEQDREATKATTNRKNEILSPRANDKAEAQKEAADEVEEEATTSTEAQAGQGVEQLSTVKMAQETEPTVSEEQETVTPAPPAPLDPVEDAATTATNLPVPPGGWAEFNQWMGRTLQYPKEAQQRKIKGQLVLVFFVNADGSLSNVHLAKKGHDLLNAEVLRVAALMKDWKPGYKNRKPCRMQVELPINFNL